MTPGCAGFDNDVGRDAAEVSRFVERRVFVPVVQQVVGQGEFWRKPKLSTCIQHQEELLIGVTSTQHVEVAKVIAVGEDVLPSEEQVAVAVNALLTRVVDAEHYLVVV